MNLINKLYDRKLIKNHDLSGIIVARPVALRHETKQLEVNDIFSFIDKWQVLTILSLQTPRKVHTIMLFLHEPQEFFIARLKKLFM